MKQYIAYFRITWMNRSPARSLVTILIPIVLQSEVVLLLLLLSLP
jgi:hypothetical protein